MNKDFIQQKLEEFDVKFNIFRECNPPHCHNMRWGGNIEELKQFLTSALKECRADTLRELDKLANKI